MWIASNYLLQQMALKLADLEPSPPQSGVLTSVYVGLYIAPTGVLTRNSLMADITPANFTGYARKALVWDVPYVGMDQLEYLEAGSVHWQPTDAVTPNVVTGLFIASAITAGLLLASAPLASPGKPLATAADALTAIVRFGLDFAGNWGGYTVLN